VEIILSGSQQEESIPSVGFVFEILNDIVFNNLSASETDMDSLKYVYKYSEVPEDSLLAQIPTWLRCWVCRDPKPSQTEPLSRTFLAFFFCAPEAYLDLLFPLLDHRESSDNHGLSSAELLALDIYAHWLVLMFLVEDEAWWSGDFPVLALQGLIRRYGDELVDGLQEQWWPGSMLEIMTRLKPWK
jgi:hypothetical protein